ncbi:uncharacterized protein MYCFIDRAFT_78728 [Pseudocercospora fijiensis CIRAD86]|uniref:Uncharacterized protein n=1 Tax=Pseudocercospora fijiensis (strain CIRAD86) TaxID=383855 RepID=M3AXL6_PSEFD|nr:uncharacterized protein MYCFIDRAFT_78728 [Pseudocercospora fijiensis CIRAD86]EME81843.1 hypothetical protein MYCFIDRAFT_78728 [Pseudocercospora fijiensis CIRAD86]
MNSNIAQPTTPATAEPEMSAGAKMVVNLLWTICYPITLVLWYICLAMLFVLKTLYLPIPFLLQPLVHLARFTLAVAALPFQVAARFETLYIYLGVAAIIGLLGGLLVAAIYSFLYNLFEFETPPEPARLRTAKEYRHDKQKKQKMEFEQPSRLSPRLLSPASLPSGYGSLSDGARNGNGMSLFATAIMEEEDSDF